MLFGESAAAIMPFEFKAFAVAFQPFRAVVNDKIWGEATFSLQGTFPHDTCAPAQTGKQFLIFEVPLFVSGDLGAPEILPRGWKLEQDTVVAVPEAPMDLDDSAVAGKRQIGLAGQFGHMQSIAEAFRIEPTSYHQFRLCILPSDASHHPAADF